MSGPDLPAGCADLNGNGTRLEQLLDFYGFMIQAHGLVLRAEDIGQLYRDICQLAVRLDQRLVLAWVGLVAPDDIDVHVAACAGSSAGYLENIHIVRVSDDEYGRGPTGRVIREGACVVVNRFQEDPSTAPWHARGREFDIASSVSVPLYRKGKVCGALMLYASRPDVFDDRIVDELKLLSQALSYAIDRADERDLRTRLDGQLLESKEILRAIFDAAQQTIMMMTPDGTVLAINRRGAERLGSTPQSIVGGNIFARFSPELASRRRALAEQVIRSGQPLTFDDERDAFSFRTTLYPLLEGSPRIVCFADETTEQRELNRKLDSAQEQLLQSEKLASIGQLAAGVAHEINNPVGFVTSNLGTLGAYLKEIFSIIDAVDGAAAANPDALAPVLAARAAANYDYLKGDIAALLTETREGLDRVRKIVLDLRDFSRVGDASWQWADLHQGLEATLNIVWNELKYRCTVVRKYGVLPQIYCLPSQLNQVFMNILLNAAQAIEKKGEITIVTEAVGDQAVRVVISDTGRGIAPENLAHIFDPFFTTKPVGQGTGLGLAVSWGIVQRHGGRIAVDSVPGKGTTFSIVLPIQLPESASKGDMAHDR